MIAADGHSEWVNSAALAAAGIVATTPDPPGGRIERDAGGEPTGVLREAAMALVSRLIPPYSDEQVDDGLTRAQAEASSYGITSVIEASTQTWMLAGYERAAARGSLTVRVHAAMRIDPSRGAEQIQDIVALHRRHGSGLFHVNAVNGARAAFVEDEQGSITEGKRADLMVIDRDPFAIEAAELSEAGVLRTLLDGRAMYRAAPARAPGGATAAP